MTEWEKSKGNRWSDVVMQRNEVEANVQVFDCRVCGQVCKSKGGLVNHRQRMHEESAAKKTFESNKCKLVFKRESERKNHKKVCGGAAASSTDRVMCMCGMEYAKSYFRRHRQNCTAWRGQQQAAAGAVPAAAKRGACPGCGVVMRKDNMARHPKNACPGSVADP